MIYSILFYIKKELATPYNKLAWIASMCLILATAILAFYSSNRELYMALFIIAGVLWCYVGIKWQKYSIFFVNAILLIHNVIGFLFYT